MPWSAVGLQRIRGSGLTSEYAFASSFLVAKIPTRVGALPCFGSNSGEAIVCSNSVLKAVWIFEALMRIPLPSTGAEGALVACTAAVDAADAVILKAR